MLVWPNACGSTVMLAGRRVSQPANWPVSEHASAAAVGLRACKARQAREGEGRAQRR